MEKKLYATWLAFAISDILVITDEQYLYLLEFRTRKEMDKQIAALQKELSCEIVEGRTKITDMIEKELQQYFEKELTVFETPLAFIGTPFQQSVWQELCEIPYGTTISYKTLAERVGNPTGYRAVANANGRNRLAIIVPCHRVVNHNGKLGGYGGGLDKKVWLLQLESDEIVLF